MIQCHFQLSLDLVNEETREVVITADFWRNEKLPFMPWVGLVISCEPDHCCLREILRYDLDQKKLFCTLDSSETDEIPDFLERFDDFIEDGWTGALCFARNVEEARELLGPKRLTRVHLVHWNFWDEMNARESSPEVKE